MTIFGESRFLFRHVESEPVSQPEEHHDAESSSRAKQLEQSVAARRQDLLQRTAHANQYIDSAFHGYQFRTEDGFFVVRDVSTLRTAMQLANARGQGAAWTKWEHYLEKYIADEALLKQEEAELRTLRPQGVPQARKSLDSLRSNVEEAAFSVDQCAGLLQNKALDRDIGHGMQDAVRLVQMYPEVDPDGALWKKSMRGIATRRFLHAAQMKVAVHSTNPLDRTLRDAADREVVQGMLAFEEMIVPGRNRIAALRMLRSRAASLLRALPRTPGAAEQEQLAREYIRIRDTYAILYRNTYLRAKEEFGASDTRLLLPERRATLRVAPQSPAVRAVEQIRDAYVGITGMEGYISPMHRDMIPDYNIRVLVEKVLKRYEHS